MYTEPYTIASEDNSRKDITVFTLESGTGSRISLQVLTSHWAPKRHKHLAVAMFPLDQYTETMQHTCKFKYVVSGEVYQASQKMIKVSFGGLLMEFQPSRQMLSKLQGLMVGNRVCLGIYYVLTNSVNKTF